MSRITIDSVCKLVQINIGKLSARYWPWPYPGEDVVHVVGGGRLERNDRVETLHVPVPENISTW